MEHSDIADAKIRLFNADGSESATAGNALRCMGKYLYDNGLVKKEDMRIETVPASGGTPLHRQRSCDFRLCGYGPCLSGCGGLPVCHRGKDGGGLPGVYRRTVLQHHLRRRGRAPLRGLLPRIDDVDVEFLGPRFEQAPISRSGSTQSLFAW